MNTTTPTARAKTVTYKTRVADYEYGVVRSIDTVFVTLTRDHGGRLSAVVDGENVGYGYAVGILNRASQVEKIEEAYLPSPTQLVGKPVAHRLHIELGRLGYRNHYALAGEVLGRAVTSLAALTAEEVKLVRSYAYGQLGLVTGQVAA